MPPTSTAPGRIPCKRAVAENTRSQSGSGAVRLDMMHPEMMALSVSVGDVVGADALDLVA